VLAASSTDTTVTLTWTAATDDVGVTGYNVYAANGDLVDTTNALTSTIRSLTPATLYTFTVKAKDAAGNLSTGISVTISTTLSGQMVPVIDYLKIQYYLPGSQITFNNNVVKVNGTALNIAGLATDSYGLPYALPADIIVAMTAIGYLKVGSSGSLVTALHQGLNSLGYNCPQNSSVYDTTTQSAVKLFQELTGLYVDGVAGPDTRTMLSTVISQKNSGWLSRGMISGDVSILQNDLYTLGYYLYDADERFGELTHNAVCSFQNLRFPTKDGIVKPEVRTALNTALSANEGSLSVAGTTANSVTLNVTKGVRKKIRVMKNGTPALPDYDIKDQEASAGSVTIDRLDSNQLYEFRLVRRNGIQEDSVPGGTQGTGYVYNPQDFGMDNANYKPSISVSSNNDIAFNDRGVTWHYISENEYTTCKNLIDYLNAEVGGLTNEEISLAAGNHLNGNNINLSVDELSLLYSYDPWGVKVYLTYKNDEELTKGVFKSLYGRDTKYYSWLDGSWQETDNWTSSGYSEADAALTCQPIPGNLVTLVTVGLAAATVYILGAELALFVEGVSLFGFRNALTMYTNNALQSAVNYQKGLYEPGGRVATVEELIAMMNQRPNVTAQFAKGDALSYLQAQEAEASHLMMENGVSNILIRQDVATRRTVFHEWLHRYLQLRNGGNMRPGEDDMIETFLNRFVNTLKLQ
jgi:peptidoglycan hydrolase-like protein with peptidoglycan-binding domain